MIRFERYDKNPILPTRPGTFYSVHTANPDLLIFNNKIHLYFRGQGEENHDQIGVLYSDPDRFDGAHWDKGPDEPIIRVGSNHDDFDSGHVLDPAAIVHDSRVLLYYSAHNIDWKIKENASFIGLAISRDGTNFEKHKANPILLGTAPEVVKFDGKIHLFLQRKTPGGFFEIWRFLSNDGIHFDEDQAQVVFQPSRIAGSFDCFSISTVRIWQEKEWFYITYGGCDRYFDYSLAIGLARSRDLTEWERYPHNPILERGEPGAWDEGALWFATVFKKGSTYYLWYEGAGTGKPGTEVSQICRDQDYGGYEKSSFSQVGLALFKGDSLAW